MSLKEKLQSSYLAFEDHLQADSPLHDVRNKAMKSFETKGFPSNCLLYTSDAADE